MNKTAAVYRNFYIETATVGKGYQKIADKYYADFMGNLFLYTDNMDRCSIIVTYELGDHHLNLF